MEHRWNGIGTEQHVYMSWCHVMHRNLHVALPVIEVVQIAQLHFGYVSIFTSILCSTLAETCT
jgi:hypothetical protein